MCEPPEGMDHRDEATRLMHLRVPPLLAGGGPAEGTMGLGDKRGAG